MIVQGGLDRILSIGGGVQVQSRSVAGADSPLLTALVAYWKLADLTDSAGANTLTNNNAVTFVGGKVGNAANFVAASSQRLSVATNAALQTINEAFCWALWYKVPSTPGGRQSLVSNLGGVSGGLGLLEIAAEATGRVAFYVNKPTSGFASVSPVTIPPTATYHFVVCWYDPATSLIWMSIDDGTPVSAALAGGPNTTNHLTLYIGARAGVSQFLTGLVDEVAFWKRVLTVAERSQLYAGGAGVTYPNFT